MDVSQESHGIGIAIVTSGGPAGPLAVHVAYGALVSFSAQKEGFEAEERCCISAHLS
jgi:hypothetical protein